MLKEAFLQHIPENFPDSIFADLLGLYFDFISPNIAILENQSKALNLDFIDNLISNNSYLESNLTTLKNNIIKDAFSDSYNVFEKASYSKNVLDELKRYLIKLGTTDIALNDLMLKNNFLDNVNQQYRESLKDFNQRKGTLSSFESVRLLQNLSTNVDYESDAIQDYFTITEGETFKVSGYFTDKNTFITETPELLKIGAKVYIPGYNIPAGLTVQGIYGNTIKISTFNLVITKIEGDGVSSIAYFDKLDYIPFAIGSIIHFENFGGITANVEVFSCTSSSVTFFSTFSGTYPSQVFTSVIPYLSNDTSGVKLGYFNLQKSVSDLSDGIKIYVTIPTYNSEVVLLDWHKSTPFKYSINTSILKSIFNETIKKLTHPVGFDIEFIRLLKEVIEDLYSYSIENAVGTLTKRCFNLTTGTKVDTDLLTDYTVDGPATVYTNGTKTKRIINLIRNADQYKFTLISDFDNLVYLYSKEDTYITSIELTDTTQGVISNIEYEEINGVEVISNITYKHYISAVGNSLPDFGTVYINDLLKVDRFVIGQKTEGTEAKDAYVAYVGVQYTIKGSSDTFKGVLPINLYSDSSLKRTSTVSIVGNGSTTTVSFSKKPYIAYPIGSYITITEAYPESFNGTWLVTDCTYTSVSFENSETLSATTQGKIDVSFTSFSSNGIRVTGHFDTRDFIPYPVGSKILLSNVVPSAYNGSWTVVESTTSTVTWESTLTDAVTELGLVDVDDSSVDEVWSGDDAGIFFEPRVYTEGEMEEFFDNPGILIEEWNENCRLVYAETVVKTEEFLEKLKTKLNFLVNSEIYSELSEGFNTLDSYTISDDYEIEDIIGKCLLKETFIDSHDVIDEMSNFKGTFNLLDEEFFDEDTSISEDGVTKLIITEASTLIDEYEPNGDVLNQNLINSIIDEYDSEDILNTASTQDIVNEYVFDETYPILSDNTLRSYFLGKFYLGEELIEELESGIYRDGIKLTDDNYSSLPL